MDTSELEVDWYVDAEARRPADGALVRKWFRCRYDPERRLQHTQDRYEVVKDGQIIETETYVSSPFLTWYNLDDALGMLETAGFTSVRAHSDFKFQPATEQDSSFIVLGSRP